MFKFDISVIIPVYNAVEYIDECISSIKNQTHDFNEIQVLLIDDGSTDGSSEICKKYSQKYENIKYIWQENSGVSVARNTGIVNSEGKYLFFLDSDDYLSKDTIKKVFNFFEANEDKVELVAYPIFLLKDNKLIKHARTDNYTKPGVYDAQVFPHFNQTTMNVCVKNLGSEKILFNTNLTFAEDATFNTQYILKKGKFGICSGGKYVYRQTTGSAVSTNRSPVIASEMLLQYCETMFLKHQIDTGVHSYAQSIVLYEINWRFRANALFPNHLNNKEYDNWFSRFKNIINQIEDKIILNQNHMDIYHKYYFLKLKETPVKVLQDSKGIYVYRNNQMIIKQNSFQIVITNYNARDNKLRIEGFIKTPILEYIDINLFIDINGNSSLLNLYESNHSYYKAKMRTNKFLAFNYVLNLDSVKNDKIKFFVQANEYSYGTAFYFTDNVIFNKEISNYLIVKDNFKFSYNKKQNVFKIKKLNRKAKLKLSLKLLNRYYKKNNKLFFIRLFSKTNTGPIWIYNDRHGVIDNGYYQFKHDFTKKDGVKRYYVIDEDIKAIEHLFTEEEKKWIIQYGSTKHKSLFLKASQILTSFQGFTEYCPFTKKGLSNFSDLLNYKLVYLQHGILHAHTPWIYSREKSRIDKFVVSSYFEKENLINNYNYKEENILLTGMPRLDFVKSSAPLNKILFAPTWRSSLIGEHVNNRWLVDSGSFEKSDYFQKINEAFQSEELIELLEKNNLTLDFNLHPIFKDVSNLFNIKSDRIKIKEDTVHLEEYKIFITDFSSYVFDYAFLNRPIIYFIPDLDYFKSGNHTYNSLDLKLEDGFGDTVLNSKQLVNEISKIIDRDFKPEQIYKTRMDNFFVKRGDHAERLYNELLKMENII